MRQFKMALLLSTAIGCAGFLHAAPVVLFSDFGAGMSFGSSNITIGGTGPGSQVIADEFVPSITASLAGVEVAVGAFNSAPVSLFLETDSGGLPGSVLEEINLPGLGLAASVVTGISSTHSQLVAGTPYWLVMTEPDAGATAFWRTNSAGVLTTATDEVANGTGSAVGPWNALAASQPLQAFEIDGTVPEPCSLLLTSLGLGAAFIIRRYAVN